MLEYVNKYNFAFIEKYEYVSNVYTLVFNYRNKIILIDYNVCDDTNIFSYYDYCEFQNNIVYKYKEVYRFLYEESVEYIVKIIDDFLDITIDTYHCDDNGGSFQTIHIDNTPLEHKFEEIFTRTYGSDAISYLQKEEPLSLLKGTACFMDYLLETNEHKIVFEENGVSYHHPQIIKSSKYKHQLEKQNCLNLLGYVVYRLSTESMIMNEQIVDDLKKYAGEKENFIGISNLKINRDFKLYKHQENILESFDLDRKKGINTTLIVLPTGAGKSQIVVEDLKKDYIKNCVGNILIMVPSVKVREDWEKRMKNSKVDIFCYNKVYTLIKSYDKEHYDYIVFDEAHHAMAANCKKTLQYFNPKFLIGLTATPDRLDNKKLQEIFGQYESSLTLKDAIMQDVVCNIRCFRIISNIDLANVRFNGVDYNYSDLEKTLTIDSRNELICKVLKKYYNPTKSFYKQGLIFCVNKSHTIKMANMLKDYGLKAEAVYGGNKHNDIYFEKYKNKEIQFLCSCQMISEGFDSPQTEVVVMARPTLSKVLYLQQIGRGTRKYPNKEALVVIDVVDNYVSNLIPWNFNSLFKINQYHDFIGIKNNTHQFLDIYGINEQIIDIHHIDIFTFETKFKDLISLELAARELYIGTKTLETWVKKNNNYCSEIVTIGKRKVPYFTNSNIDTIRIDKKLGIHNDGTILDDFINFVDENTLTFSYKLIFLKSVFKVVNKKGNINIDELVNEYIHFYLDRLKNNKVVDKKNCPYTLEYLSDYKAIKRSLLENPFEKFERKRFFYYTNDLNIITFNSSLWEKLTKNTIITLNNKLDVFIKEYYEKFVD